MKTIRDVEEILSPYVHVAKDTLRKGVTTDRTLELSKVAGSPHKRLQVVHVAGTSGKTSTCYYIRELLEASGMKTGLTVSPHMVSITDRVQVDGKPISDEKFVAYMNEFMQFVSKCSNKPTYFEIMIVFALWVFEKEGVDYAVLETGLGGLHDSTNICRRADKVCVITDIGYDHTHVLGRTLPEIAEQKSGIIAEDNEVIMYEQPSEIMSVVKSTTTIMRAHLQLVDEVVGMTVIPDAVEYQRRNWHLAFTVFKFIQKRDGIPEISSNVSRRTARVTIPGRIELIDVKGKTIILDGAHNEQKMRTFWTSFEQKFPGIKPLVVFGMKAGKDVERLVPLVASHASEAIVTSSKVTQDFALGTGVNPDEIAPKFSSINVKIIADARHAIDEALLSNVDTVVVTGSLYLVAEIRTYLQSNVL